MCVHKKTCPEFYIINPYTFSDCELRWGGTKMLAIMKSIWTYLKRIVYAALHTHMKTAAQPVFI